MIKLGPIVIMKSKTLDSYINVARAAWAVHQLIWFFGENNAFQPGLENLPVFDQILSDMLSRIPPIEEGE